MIDIKEASLSYQDTTIFDKLLFSIREQQWTAILGPSGIGKTSLLKLIAGLLPTKSSSRATLMMNKPLSIEQDIAYLPQEDLLLPWLSVYNNLLIGTRLRQSTLNRDALAKKAHALLAQVKLTDAAMLYPHQLSGGMRQRLMLAQLLIQDKPIIFMDEPFKSLDAMTRFQLQTLFTELLKDKTVVFITHDLQEATRLAHTIYFMHGHPATLTLAATLDEPIPRDLTAESVIAAQKKLYPLWMESA